MQAEGGVDEEFEVLLVPLVLVGSLDLLVAGACPALMDLRDPKVRTETGVSLDHPDPKEREVTSADLVLPVSYQKYLILNYLSTITFRRKTKMVHSHYDKIS